MNIQLILFTVILGTSATSCIHRNNSENNTKNITTTVQQQKIEKIEKIQLVERTRGFSKSIIVTPSSKESNINEEITNTKIAPAEWKTISQLARTIDLPKIAELKSPTTGRHSDQAMIASIIITSDGKEYTSSDFDSGHPPKELEALYNVINGPEKRRQ